MSVTPGLEQNPSTLLSLVAPSPTLPGGGLEGKPGLSPCCLGTVAFVLAVLPAQSHFLPAARGPGRC